MKCAWDGCEQYGNFRYGYCFIHYVKVYVTKETEQSDMYGPDASFARAQQAYDNAEPPGFDWEGVMKRECGVEHEREITNVLGFTEDVTSLCAFDGEVDVQAEGGVLYWTCPECGYDHTQDAAPEFEEDPDDARDRWLDAQADRMRDGED